MAGGRRYGLRPTPQPPAIRVQGVGHFYFGGKHTKWVRFKSALTADYIGPFVMKSIAQGAATSCYVATRPDLASTSGRYFEDCQAVAPGGYMEDDAMAGRLWKKSVELTKLYLPASSAQ